MLKIKIILLGLIIFLLAGCSGPVSPERLDATPSMEPTLTKTDVPIQPLTEPISTGDEPLSFPVLGEIETDGVDVKMLLASSTENTVKIELRVAGLDDLNGACPISLLSVSDDAANTYEVFQPQNFDFTPKSSRSFCQYRPVDDEFHFLSIFSFQQNAVSPTVLNIHVEIGDFLVYPEDENSYELPAKGPYDFTTPVSDDRLALPDFDMQSLSEGFTFELVKVDIGPSFFTADYCVSNPNLDGWFTANPRLWIDNLEIESIENLSKPHFQMIVGDSEDKYPNSQCYQMVFPIDLMNEPNFLSKKVSIEINSILVDRSEGITEELCADIKAELQTEYPGVDFACHITESEDGLSFGFEIISVPPSLTTDDIFTLFEERLSPVIQTDIRFEDLLHK